MARRIFTNRGLPFDTIQAVGFDLDYTLAEYIPETFDALAYNGALKKLAAMGYPKEVLNFKYDPYAYQRGLVIDKKRGNLVKLDRHKYVKVAYHGLTRLPRTERHRLYQQNYETMPQFSPPDFASVDTAFLLVDVHLFAQLVDLKDKLPGSIPHSYEDVYRHVRRAVDLCHCDGEIKDPVAVDPAKYILKSPHLADMLTQMRLGGKQVFLLTNSLYDYTEVVCKYLLGDTWLDYFDLVICGARKPGFLVDPFLPLFQVRTEDASLINIEVDSKQRAQKVMQKGKVFQGGNWNHLHRLLGVATGTKIMYVGDHMYSDILRSKRTLGWRTVLIVPELEQEVEQAIEQRESHELIQQLLLRRSEIEERLSAAKLKLLRQVGPADLEEGSGEMSGDDDFELTAEIEKLQVESDQMTAKMEHSLRKYHTGFHATWGQLFKAGHQNSRWAQQVQEYACLYTSHASNLMSVAPDTNLHIRADVMPHDQLAKGD